MRTTVEITPEQHRALSTLAQKRGLRGFSSLVQEALAEYLAALDTNDVELLLGLEGILDDAEAEEMRSRIEATRGKWRA